MDQTNEDGPNHRLVINNAATTWEPFWGKDQGGRDACIPLKIQLVDGEGKKCMARALRLKVHRRVQCGSS